MKVLFFDIDGTLYDNKNDSIPLSTIESLNKLHQKGYKLFIASGRPHYMLDAIKAIRHLFCGMICFNGSVVFYQDEIIYKRLLSTEEVKEVEDFFLSHHKVYGYYGLESEGMTSNEEYYTSQFTMINFNIPPFIESLANEKNIVETYIFTEDLSELSELKNFKIIPWHEKGADIILKTESKLNAIKFVKEYFNLNEDDLYVFGDGANDEEMLSGIKNSTCMANGAECSLKAARYITTSVDNDGIKNALEYWGLL